MPFQRRGDQLPEWLWIFLIVPLSLVVLLLWRQRSQRFALAQMRQRRETGGRYQEPDSIPIETHRAPEPVRERGDFGELGVDEEDVAMASVTASEGADEPSEQPARGGEPLTGAGMQQETQPAAENLPEAQGEPDDLVIIEGIGKSIAGLLNSRGITTFRQLANTPVEQLQQILVEARLQHLADPETWPEQARLAADGRMDDLEALQRTLKGGRRA